MTYYVFIFILTIFVYIEPAKKHDYLIIGSMPVADAKQPKVHIKRLDQECENFEVVKTFELTTKKELGAKNYWRILKKSKKPLLSDQNIISLSIPGKKIGGNQVYINKDIKVNEMQRSACNLAVLGLSMEFYYYQFDPIHTVAIVRIG